MDGVRRRLSMPRTTLPPCERLGQGELKNTKKKKEEGGRGKGRGRGGEGEIGEAQGPASVGAGETVDKA